ncbi:MAG: class I SAM-dependent methyltransferase [Candidatus Doudnabacteria bacterium]|nr:class I SAM-dependent methyltransferase [Candidatus Doudnabacteria bacterium]
MSSAEYHSANETFQPSDSYQKVKRLLDFESAKKLRILDVGSGSGALGNKLIGLGHQVTGLDVNPEALKCPWVMLCDVTKDWPVEEQSFDAVVCTDVAEHLEDPGHILRQSKKVLRPDGVLIFGVPNHFDLRQRLRMLFGGGIVHWDNIRHGQYAESYMHLRFFTLKDLVRLFNREHFFIDKSQYNFMGGGIMPSRFTPVFVRKFLLARWPGLFSGKFIFLLRPRTVDKNHDKPQVILLPATPRGL